MSRTLRTVLLCGALAALSTGTAAARWYRYYEPVVVAYVPDTGGYCDRYGCPDRYWTYSIFYGPIYYNGVWYRGPVYVRDDRGRHYFWVHGGWRRDEWHAPRPDWALNVHFGPPRGLDYYASHGFNVRGYGGSGDWRGGPDRWGQNGPDDGWHRADQGSPRDYAQSGLGNGGSYDQGRSDNHGDTGPHGPGRPNLASTIGAPPTIHVTAATYGATCGVPKGNVTKSLQDSCDGRSVCDYSVDFRVLGDKAPGCRKDFSVEWTCANGSGGTATAPAEAGLGSRVTLQCAQAGHG